MLTRRLGPHTPLGEHRLDGLSQLGLEHGHFVSPDGGTRVKISGSFAQVSQDSQIADGFYTSARNVAGDKTLIYGSPDCYEFLPFGKLAPELSGTGSFGGVGDIARLPQGYGLLANLYQTIPETGAPAGWDAYASVNYMTWDGTTAKLQGFFYAYRRSTGDTLSSFVTRTNDTVRLLRAGFVYDGALASYLSYKVGVGIVPTIRMLAPQGYVLWPTPPYNSSKLMSSDLPLYIITPQIWVLLIRYIEATPATPFAVVVTRDAGVSWTTMSATDAAGLLDPAVRAMLAVESSFVAVRDKSGGFNETAAFVSTVVRSADGTLFSTSLYRMDLSAVTLEKIFEYSSRAGSGLSISMIHSRSGIIHVAFDYLNSDLKPQVYASIDYAAGGGDSLLVPIHTGELPVKTRWCGTLFNIDETTIGLTAWDGEKYVIYETRDTADQATLGSNWTLRTVLFKGTSVPAPGGGEVGLTHFNSVVHLHQNDEPTYRNAARPWLEDAFYPAPG